MRMNFMIIVGRKAMEIMKKIIIPIALCSILMASKAFAATIDSVVVSDFENSVLTVSGTAEPGENGVSIVVLKKGQTLNSGMLYSNNSAVHFVEANELKYNAEFQFLGDEGFYEVHAGNCDKVYEFEFIAKESVLNFVDDLGKKQIPQNEIFKKLERYGISLGVDIAFAATESDKNYLAKTIYESNSKISTDGIEGIKETVLLVQSELEFMSKLKTASVPSSVNKLFADYADSVKIDLVKYNGLSDTEKTQVCLKFVEADYTDIKTFKTDFEKAVNDVINDRKGGSGNTGTGGGGNTGSGSRDLPAIVQNSSGVAAGQQAVTGEENKLHNMFTDMGDVEWAWDSVLFVVEKNIMNGSGDGKFEPNAPLTREQLAKIITLAFGFYDGTLVSDFADVGNDSWASSYVASAKANGLMVGVDDVNFGCGNPVTRQDLCTAMYRAAQKCGIKFENNKTDFNDFDKIKDYSKEAVGFMAGSGIISGMGDGNFAPDETATRAQAAKIISAVITKGDR